jgi:purine catabolism regulator
VVEQGALVCAVEMSRTKAVREAEKRLKGDLLNALLQENLSPQDAQLWAQNMGLDLSEAHVAMRFAWLGAAAPSRRRLETLISGEVTRLGLKVIVNPMGSEIVCFCQVARGLHQPEIAIQLAQAVLDQAGREYTDTRVLCGLGTPSKDITEWRSSFRQAGQALELSRRFREQKPLFFPDLSVYRLLIQLENSPELIAFQEEMLGALLASEGARELIHTLQVYFEHNGNLSQAAEALFVHRNTLIYRMERIATLTGANLDDPEIRLAMQLALHIFRMMEKTGA